MSYISTFSLLIPLLLFDCITTWPLCSICTFMSYCHIVLDLSEGDEYGSFILKDKSYSGSGQSDTVKVAKYSIALQYLFLDRIVEEQPE